MFEQNVCIDDSWLFQMTLPCSYFVVGSSRQNNVFIGHYFSDHPEENLIAFINSVNQEVTLSVIIKAA